MCVIKDYCKGRARHSEVQRPPIVRWRLDYLNLDWTNINIGYKFCRVVSNGMSDENYRLDIRSAGVVALKLKEAKKNNYLKNVFKAVEKQKHTRNRYDSKGFVPEDEEKCAWLWR
jgi:hypothetical protein